MRIAFIVGRFPSISETFILNQITGLIDAGHEVDIFSFNLPKKDEKEHQDVENYHLLARTHYILIPQEKGKRLVKAMQGLPGSVLTYPRDMLRSLNVSRFGREALSLKLFLTMKAFVDKGHYDILNCHFGKLGLAGMRLKQMGIPGKLVVNFHGYDVSQLVNDMGENVYECLFEEADLLMPVSKHWQRKLVELGADADKTFVHHMGIDTSRFEFKARQKNNDEPTLLITVGRLVEKKGIDDAIRAIANVVKRHPDWNIRYLIVGEGPLREALEKLVRDLGMDHVVQFRGSARQDEVRNIIMDAHIFLLPSFTAYDGDQEGIPVSLMEAMASGMPVLSTLHSGIPELVQDGQSGFLVPERNVDALAEKLDYLITHPESWPEMGYNGRSFVDNNFNIHKLNQQLVEIYHFLLSQKDREFHHCQNFSKKTQHSETS
jgi:colanic acid/amylovoran biosynthesis glycosyltransferase